MGAGWEVSLRESLHLPLLAPAAGFPWSDRGKVGFFALLFCVGFWGWKSE